MMDDPLISLPRHGCSTAISLRCSKGRVRWRILPFRILVYLFTELFEEDAKGHSGKSQLSP